MIGDVLRLRYEVEQKLGEDAVFVTLLGRDRVRNRPVVLKLLRPEFRAFPELRIAMKIHADTMSQQRWPGIAACLAMDEHDGCPFLVYEPAPGVSLEERIRRVAPMSVPVAVDIAISICNALEGPHRAGYTSARLRPANVMVNLEGSVTLNDFGLRSVTAAHPDTLRADIAAAGPYMAPELFIGGEEIPASDVYSVGVMLFEMLTAERPVRVAPGTDAHVMPGVPMRTLNPAVPAALEALVEKATSASISTRHSDATQLLLDLKEVRDALRFGRLQERAPFRTAVTATTSTPAPIASAPGTAQKPEKIASVPQQPEPPRKQPLEPKPAPGPDVPRWLSLVNISLTVVAILVMMAGAAYIFLSVTKPKEVTVPALVGKTVVEARQILKERNLVLRIASQSFNDRFPPDTIYATVPPAGERVKEGATVAAYVSLGPRLVVVPDVRNLPEERARALLAEVGFKKVSVAAREYSTSVPDGAVIRQAPQPGLEVDPSQPVQLVLSMGPEPVTPLEESAVPRIWRIPIAIPPGAGDEVHVQVEFEDETGPRLVYDAVRFAGEEFDVTVSGYGERARVTVRLNGRRLYRRYLEPEL